jgi:hypothetical protein
MVKEKNCRIEKIGQLRHSLQTSLPHHHADSITASHVTAADTITTGPVTAASSPAQETGKNLQRGYLRQ